MTSTHQQWRANQYYAYDPYSRDIAPALLNSVDIKKYIDIGCLLETATFDSDLLKPASYEMRFLGKLYDWVITDEGQLKPRCREIVDKKPAILQRNSITYLWMAEQLLLPEYIAARFNLHIRHVHKGLLLGTGPLVDSGFSGSLLIPLHNLTNNNYEICGGDGIIWVEFTKLSKNEYWEHQNKEGLGRPENLKEFPDAKDLDDPLAYFLKSEVTAQGGVQSAFHGALDETRNAADTARKGAEEARESAQKSRDTTDRFRKIYTWIGAGTAILVVAAIATIIVQSYSLVSQVVTTTNEVHRQVEADRQQETENTQSVTKRIESLEERLENATTDVHALKNRIDLIQQEPAPGPQNTQQ